MGSPWGYVCRGKNIFEVINKLTFNYIHVCSEIPILIDDRGDTGFLLVCFEHGIEITSISISQIQVLFSRFLPHHAFLYISASGQILSSFFFREE